jgi:hypothetical protein
MREAAQYLREDAQDGICWIALWKDGRGWSFNTFYLDEKRDGTVVLDYPEDLQDLQGILAADPHAIIVNGYQHNLAVSEGYVTRDDLARALRWQYDLQHFTLADFMERIVQPAQEAAAHEEQTAADDLDEMHKTEEPTEDEQLAAWDSQERSVTLTNKDWSRLVCYLLMSTKYREGERDAWQSLAQEKNPDGSPKFEKAASNAAYWQEVIDDLERIRPKLDGMEV